MSEQQRRRPLLILLSGLPGCGKSTLRAHLHILGGAGRVPILSRDDVIDTIANSQGVTYSDVWNMAPKLIDFLFERRLNELKEKNIVIWDATHISRKSRQRSMRHFPEHQIICVQFSKADYNFVKGRLDSRSGKLIPIEVYNNFYNLYEEAVGEEGFDQIIKVATSSGKVMSTLHQDKNGQTKTQFITENQDPIKFLLEFACI